MRRLKGILCLLALFFSVSSCSTSSEPILHLFVWAETFKPELIDEFQKKYHCHVTIDTFDSNESMYAKLQLSSAKYDIIFPSNYFVEVLEKQNMIKPLDLKLIPNSRNIDPKYFSQKDPQMAIPYLVSFSGIAYRKDKVHAIDPSWSVFARSDLRGRMTMLNDAREALGAALRFLGYSINTRDPRHISEATEVLIQWKKNLAKFDNEQYRHGIASGEFLVVQGYSIDIMQVQAENNEVAFLYPKEGSIASVDALAISRYAQNSELAHSFINFMLEPENGIQNVLYTNGLVPLPAIYEQIQADEQKKHILFPHAEALKKMETIQDLGADTQLYYLAWEQVKSS